MIERLTVKWTDNVYDTLDPVDIVNNEYSKINYNKILTKLGQYEDAEEQGLMLRLPCKVGDTIYVIPSITNYRLMKLNGHPENNKVYEQIVHSVQMFSNCRYSLITCEGCASVVSDFYKETWFLTKEEAKQKLKEMESDCNDD